MAALVGSGTDTSTLPLVFLVGVAVLCTVGVEFIGSAAGEGCINPFVSICLKSIAKQG